MKNTARYIVILLVYSNTIYGHNFDSIKTKKNPAFIQMQYAGNMGLVSLGIGKLFSSENISLCLIYGYLPEHINGVSVHTLALKASVNYIKFYQTKKAKLNGYFGTALINGFTNNTFRELPGYYPDNYYEPNAYHVALFTGAKHTRILKNNKLFSRVSAFLELGTLDYIIWYGLKTDFIDFFDLWNISFGIAFNIYNSKK